jgi:hypothetical protein
MECPRGLPAAKDAGMARYTRVNDVGAARK